MRSGGMRSPVAGPKEWEAFGEGEQDLIVYIELSLREWNVLILRGYLLILFFIMYVLPDSLCENVRKTLAKSAGAVGIMPE